MNTVCASESQRLEASRRYFLHRKGPFWIIGSLIYITLQRSKTARQAIRTMVDLMDTYGYASEGESFSSSRSIGRSLDHGSDWERNIVWQDGCRLGGTACPSRLCCGRLYANQARIQTFPRDDPENCIYADDVVDVAIHYNLFSSEEDPIDVFFFGCLLSSVLPHCSPFPKLASGQPLAVLQMTRGIFNKSIWTMRRVGKCLQAHATVDSTL
jgi:hypothetical protein